MPQNLEPIIQVILVSGNIDTVNGNRVTIGYKYGGYIRANTALTVVLTIMEKGVPTPLDAITLQSGEILDITDTELESILLSSTNAYVNLIGVSNLIESGIKIRSAIQTGVSITNPIDGATGYLETIEKVASKILVNNSAITANGNANFTPVTNKITLTVHITNVSGTSPTLQLFVYGIDANGNVLTGDALGSTPVLSAVGDTVVQIDIYGLRSVQIAWKVGGTSQSFTATIGVSG